MALARTVAQRPDLLARRGGLDEEERRLLDDHGLGPAPAPALEADGGLPYDAGSPSST
jgi:hypothetical protein